MLGPRYDQKQTPCSAPHVLCFMTVACCEIAVSLDDGAKLSADRNPSCSSDLHNTVHSIPRTSPWLNFHLHDHPLIASNDEGSLPMRSRMGMGNSTFCGVG